jgi:hypothetical protein
MDSNHQYPEEKLPLRDGFFGASITVPVPKTDSLLSRRGTDRSTKRLRALEAENAELKRLLAAAMLNSTALKDLLGKMVTPVAHSPGYRSSQEDILSQPAACPL